MIYRIKQKLSIAICSFLGNMMVIMKRNQKGHKHRNFIYAIEKKMNGKWGLDWDFGAYLTYDVADQVMHDFEKYTKNPEEYRLVMYISEKPHDK